MLQRGTFETIGYSVVSLGAKEHFYLLTSLFSKDQAGNRKGAAGFSGFTGNVIDSTGLMGKPSRFIPHRAAMFATSLLIYCVVMMAKSVSVGVAT